MKNEELVRIVTEQIGEFTITPHAPSMGPRGAIAHWIVMRNGETVYKAYDKSDCCSFARGALWEREQMDAIPDPIGPRHERGFKCDCEECENGF